jgi:hypothetical protein
LRRYKNIGLDRVKVRVAADIACVASKVVSDQSPSCKTNTDKKRGCTKNTEVTAGEETLKKEGKAWTKDTGTAAREREEACTTSFWVVPQEETNPVITSRTSSEENFDEEPIP